MESTTTDGRVKPKTKRIWGLLAKTEGSGCRSQVESAPSGHLESSDSFPDKGPVLTGGPPARLLKGGPARPGWLDIFDGMEAEKSRSFPFSGQVLLSPVAGSRALPERDRHQAFEGSALRFGQPEILAKRLYPAARAKLTSWVSRRFSEGFSLVETLIAMAIVFFLLVGAAQMLCYSLLLKQKADLHRISSDLLSARIETLKSLDPENEAFSPGIHQETVQDKNTGRYFLLSWEVIEEKDGLKKIQLSLYPPPFGSRPPVRACWFRSGTLGF